MNWVSVGRVVNGYELDDRRSIPGRGMGFSLCHNVQTYWGSGGLAPRILDLGTTWR